MNITKSFPMMGRAAREAAAAVFGGEIGALRFENMAGKLLEMGVRR